tara:strand:+ start:338 stop:1075 length:738 start_codon:yes stop_codon:yes gene_type:complete
MKFIKLLIYYLIKKLSIVTGEVNKNDVAGALHKSWGYIVTNFIKGDYVEFGVYKGGSFVESYQQRLVFKEFLNQQLNHQEKWRREFMMKSNYHKFKPIFHGLDTFDGMPENDEQNIIFEKGSYFSNYDSVKKKCLKNGIPSESFFLYKGNFKNTKNELKENLKNRKVAIVNFDCDLYSSTKEAIFSIENNLQIGSVLLFDDWNTFNADNNKGQRKAFLEFQKTTNLKFEKWFTYKYVGQAFLCTS